MTLPPNLKDKTCILLESSWCRSQRTIAVDKGETLSDCDCESVVAKNWVLVISMEPFTSSDITHQRKNSRSLSQSLSVNGPLTNIAFLYINVALVTTLTKGVNTPLVWTKRFSYLYELFFNLRPGNRMLNNSVTISLCENVLILSFRHELAEPLHRKAVSIRRKSKAPRVSSVSGNGLFH